MFKPIIHECEVREGEESFIFYVREPSGREILLAADKLKKNQDRASIENARDLFSKYIVKQNGDAISQAEVEELLDMRLSAMQQVSEQVQEKIGIRKVGEQPKNA